MKFRDNLCSSLQKHHPRPILAELRVEGFDVSHQVEQMTCGLYSREAAADHHNRQQSLPFGAFGLHGSLLKTSDDLIAQDHTVAHCPERVSMGCHARNNIEVDV